MENQFEIEGTKASVIMPCFNHAKFVRESARAILGQTFRELELIIVDDCSRDDSVPVLESLARSDSRVKVILHTKNLGASRSRNDGLRAARGTYVGFCDADDIWKPTKLAAQIALLEQNPSFDVAYCDSEIIDGEGNKTGELFSHQFSTPSPPTGDLFASLCRMNFVNMQTVLLRRMAVGDRLFFDENIKWVEDWWQWIRLSKRHRFIYDERPLANYRVHTHSTGFTQKPGIRRNRWKVCKRNLRQHPDLPGPLKARLWYMMGLELSLMGRTKQARRFLCHATSLGIRHRCPPMTMLAMSVRSARELIR